MKKLLRAFNHARFWRGRARMEGHDLFHPSFDRWLYLTLHRWHVMGRLERRVIDHFVLPGMHVVDVGANIGLYTLYFWMRVGEKGSVTALEPVPELGEALVRAVEMNRMVNVKMIACAAGAAEGSVHLSLDPMNSGNNWIGQGEGVASRGEISVPARRMDGLGLDPVPDFVKIDVQGWEVQVLEGMSGFFEKGLRPTLFCEVSETSLRLVNSSTERLGRTLLDFGYGIYLPEWRGAGLELRTLTLAELNEHAARKLYFDVIALAEPSGRSHSGPA